MNSKITINDVAQALGVSKTTVSRAISGKGRIGNETREKVLSYIEQHEYKPSAVAKSLAESKTYNIGFVVPGAMSLMDMPFFQKCMFSITETASAFDYDVIISSTDGEDLSHLERLVNNHKVDGIILARTTQQDPCIRYLKSKHIPFVTIGTTTEPDVIQVDNDHFNACKELTSLLLLKGITRLGLIGSDKSHVVTRLRYDGFVAGYEALQMEPNYKEIFLDCNNMSSIERAVDEMLESDTQCIVCMDDYICRYVLNKLHREQVGIPQDIRVASFYDNVMQENDTATLLPVTSIHFNIQEMAQAACRTLIDAIEGRDYQYKRLFGYNIILSNSTQSN